MILCVQVVPSSTPFQRDVRELKSIVGRIAVASRFTRQPKSCALAKERSICAII